jgi:hypothetical protein
MCLTACLARTEHPWQTFVEAVSGTSTANADVAIGAAGEAGKVGITTDQPLSGAEGQSLQFVFSGRASGSPGVRTFFVAPGSSVIDADLG